MRHRHRIPSPALLNAHTTCMYAIIFVLGIHSSELVGRLDDWSGFVTVPFAIMSFNASNLLEIKTFAAFQLNRIRMCFVASTRCGFGFGRYYFV